jgi:hypothetical protein
MKMFDQNRVKELITAAVRAAQAVSLAVAYPTCKLMEPSQFVGDDVSNRNKQSDEP